MAPETEAQAVEPVHQDKSARYRARNREKRNAQSRDWWAKNGVEWVAKNRDSVRAAAAKYRDANRDTVRQRAKRCQSENPDRQRESERKYRATHKDRRRASVAAYRAKDGTAEREREGRRTWAANHHAELCAKAAIRRALKMRATPAWVNLDAVAAVYVECRRRSLETGIKHHVDHMVPLKSKWVCGLHVESNLQILIGRENQSKGNRFWPNQMFKPD